MGCPSSVVREPKIYRLPETHIAPKGSIQVIIKAEQERHFNFTPNSERSNIGAELMDLIRKQIKVSKDTFPLPNYTRS